MTVANTAMAKTGPCGCTGEKTAAPDGCGCGCGGCSSCRDTAWTECETGTSEATRRGGVATRPCLPPRPRFFRGELVTDMDLGAVIDYHRAQELLSNRAIGGWGIYCGYELSVDAKSCSLTVGRGVAYDAKGRALIHGGATLRRPSPADLVEGRDPCDPCAESRESETLWLAAAYDDCLDAAKPRYSTPCGPSNDPGCDFSRVQERVRFVWLDHEPDHDYWISGCLADPCADDPPLVDPECRLKWKDEKEPALDRCTPKVGIRGGLGVNRYTRAALEYWNLPRNLGLVEKNHENCSAALAAAFDVISTLGCAPCCGEPLVVLAKVTFGPSNAPSIRVEPVRKRVLSNSALTSLVLWLYQASVCKPGFPGGVAERERVPERVACADPCEGGASELAKKVSKAVLGHPLREAEYTATYHHVLAHIVENGVRGLEELDWSRIEPVVETSLGSPSRQRLEAIRQRFAGIGTYSAREESARFTLEHQLRLPDDTPTDEREELVAFVAQELLERKVGTIAEAPLESRVALQKLIEKKKIALDASAKAFLETGVDLRTVEDKEALIERLKKEEEAKRKERQEIEEQLKKEAAEKEAAEKKAAEKKEEKASTAKKSTRTKRVTKKKTRSGSSSRSKKTPEDS